MFEKIKSKLSKEYEEENNKVREMKRRRDLLESISFHERFTRVLGLSTVFYMMSFGALVISGLPVMLIPFLVMSSLGTSVLIDRALIKKFNNKKRVQEFSKASKNTEIEEEIIKLDFEIDRVISYAMVKQEAIKVIKDKVEMCNKLSLDYDLSRKNVDSSAISELDKRINYNYSKLDRLSKKRVISDKFYRLMSKSNKFYDTCRYSMMFGVMSMLMLSAPFMIGKFNPNLGLTIILSSPFVGVLCPIIYFNKRDKMQKKILDKLGINISDYSDEIGDSLELAREMGLDVAKVMEYSEIIINKNEFLEEENVESRQVARIQVADEVMEVEQTDIKKLGLNKRYPN